MTVIGKILRESRENRNLKIEELSKILQISSYNIAAIESGNFEKTPGEPYTLGFIKTYSNYLNLDTDFLVNIYRDEIDNLKNNKKGVSIPVQTYGINFINYKFIVASSLFFIFAFIFYYLFLSKTNMSENYAQTPDLDEEMLAMLEKEEIMQKQKAIDIIQNDIIKEDLALKNMNKIVVEEFETQDNRKAIASVDKSKIELLKEQIILRFKSDTWIQIRDSEQNIIISKLMKQKEEFILAGGTKYFITTGNAGGVEIFENNRLIGSLGKKGEILNSFVLDTDFLLN